MSAVRKKKPTLEQQINEDGIRFLGKHISREKALALMVVTTLACAMPIVLGVMRWEQIPQLVTTGLTVTAALVNWWKNNSFTPEAIKADGYLEQLREKQ